MSFLTAALYGLGAFGHGRQQGFENKLAQQQQQQTATYEDAQMKAENERLQREQLLANAGLLQKGLSPEGKPLPPIQMHLPPSLMRVVPGNVGTHYKVTSQDQVNHQINLLRFQAEQYRNAGRTDYADSLDATADGLQKQVMADIAQADRDREQALREQAQDRRNAATIAGALQRNQNTIGGAMNRVEVQQSGATDRTLIGQGGATARTQMQIDAANQRAAQNIAQRYDSPNDVAVRAMQAANDKATAAGKPLPHPGLADFKGALTHAIATVTQDPKQLSVILKNMVLYADQQHYDPELIDLAREQLQAAARDALQAQQANKKAQFLPVTITPGQHGPPPSVQHTPPAAAPQP